MESIGREIKTIIKKKGLSFYQVAKDLEVRWESLYRSLDDGANPEWKRIKQILDYLGYDLKLIKTKEVKKAKPKPPMMGRKKR